MAKDKKNTELLLSKRLQLAITVGALLVGLANVWIASKLAPIAQSVAVVTTRVQAIEENQTTFVPRNEVELQPTFP